MPILVEDISSSFHDLDFKGVKAAEELIENPAFEFLQGWLFCTVVYASRRLPSSIIA